MDAESPCRRLAAVLIADIVGYSRLMEGDEQGTHARVCAIFGQMALPSIAGHGGRLVRRTGDGLLAEFPSATAALQCALDMQRRLERLNRSRATAEAGASSVTRTVARRARRPMRAISPKYCPARSRSTSISWPSGWVTNTSARPSVST